MRKAIFLLAILLCPLLAAGMDFYVKGDVDISAELNGIQLKADFGPEYIRRAGGSLTVLRDGSDAGRFLIEFSFSKDFTADKVNLQTGSNIVGTADLQADAVNEKLVISSLSWNGGKNLLGTWSLEDGLEKTFYAKLVKDDKTIGTVSFHPKVFGMNEGTNIFTIPPSSQLNLVLTTESLLDQATIVTNSFRGFVTSVSGLPVTSGKVLATAGGFIAVSNIEKVGSRGGYGFYGTPLVISGIPGTEAEFFIAGDKVGSAVLTSDPERRLDLVWSQPTSDDNFPDFDFDGVPNNLDKCPNTFHAAVNAEGCSCKQIMITHNNQGRCVVTADKGPVWIPPPPPTPKCPELFRDSCMPERPKFCDKDLQVVNDCEKCGCSPGFECNPVVNGIKKTDGNCYKVVKTQNVICLKNNYKMAAGLDCSTLGDNWVDVFAQPGIGDLSDYVNVRVRGNFWASTKKRHEIRDDAINMLRAQTLCVQSENIGCVLEGTKCLDEAVFYESYHDILISLEERLDGQFRRETYNNIEIIIDDVIDLAKFNIHTEVDEVKALIGDIGTSFEDIGSLLFERKICWIPTPVGLVSSFVNAIGSVFFGDISVEYNLNPVTVADFPIRLNSSCPDVLADASITCNALGPAGHSADNFDIFFIGDAFHSNDELKKTVALLLDKESNATGTVNEGLFSREPFKSRKDDFNIWVKDGGEFTREEQNSRPSYGLLPVRAEAEKLNLGCSQRDLTIVVSKAGPYRSYCPTRKLCFLSLPSEQFPGRALLKLLGTGFGLADESYFNITEFLVPESIADLYHADTWASPNCKRTKEKAEETWGGLVSPDNAIDYFKSCGGDCDNSCVEFIRPTFNSVMRNISVKCTDSTCTAGPPFDPYYVVNKKKILEEMLEFEEPLEKD